MRTKKILFVTIVLILIVALTCSLVACSDDKEEEVDVVRAFGDVLTKIFKSNEIDINQSFYGDMAMELAIANKSDPSKDIHIGINVLGNMDLTPSGDNTKNNVIFELFNKTGGKNDKILGIYADGEFLYLDTITNHYQLENFKIYDMLRGASPSDWTGIMDIGGLVAGLLFDKAEINGDDYVFHYDLNNLLNALENSLNETFTKEELDSIAHKLNYPDWATLQGDLRQINGELRYDFRGDTFIGKTWKNNSKNMTMDMNLAKFDFNNGAVSLDFKNYLPKDVEWKITKALNFNVNGNFTIKDKDNAKLAKYTFELRTNLDLFELLANKGDFNLDEDDMAHFVIRNKLSDNSEDYNNSRIKAKSGVIFELAYSPQELKTKNILATVNLKAILPSSMFDELGLPPSTANMIPDYYGLHIDNDVFREFVAGFEDGKSEELMTKLTKMVVKTIKGGNNLKIKQPNIKDETMQGLVSSMLTCGKRNLDNVDFAIDSFVYADNSNKEYKLGEHFLNIANEENQESKDFGKALGYYPAKESQAVKTDGFIEITTKDGVKINKDKPIAKADIDKLIGGSVKYKYTDFYGAERAALSGVKIVGYSDFDDKKLGVAQSINLITSPPDGKNLGSLLISLGIIPPLPLNVYTTNIIVN